MKLVRYAMSGLVDHVVLQGPHVDLKAAQALEPSHTGELMEIVENAEIELHVVRIALNHSTDLGPHKLLLHSHRAMRMRSVLQGL